MATPHQTHAEHQVPQDAVEAVTALGSDAEKLVTGSGAESVKSALQQAASLLERAIVWQARAPRQDRAGLR